MDAMPTGLVYDLYESCCQRPALMADALARIHGGDARGLHEDFCGSAAVSRAWCRIPGKRAVATDTNVDVIAFAQSRAHGLSTQFLCASVLNAPAPNADADVIFAGNFSVGELHDRADLLRYLSLCRARVREGGVCVCDVFGAQPRTRGGSLRRMVDLGAGRTVEYTWEQRSWDPWTSRVLCAIHFRVIEQGDVVESIPNAFEYNWRVWGVAELMDAMKEAGFRHTSVVDPFSETLAPDAHAAAVLVIAR